MKQQKYDFFINYSRKDIDKARRIADVLRNLGFSYFFDIDNVVRGVDYNTVFKSAIENCNTMIFVSSKNSNTSSWVMAELNYAVNSSKRILPVIIDGTSYSEKIKMLIGDNVSIDVQNSIESSSFEKSFTKVLKIFLEDSNNQINMLSGINRERPIFISYSQKDKALVHPFVEQISKAVRKECWIDLTGIESGEEFENVIMKAIDDCKTVLFMLSDNSLSSLWTKREVYYAEGEKKKIVPVVIDHKGLRGWFKFHFGNIDYVDANKQEHVLKLINNLKAWFNMDLPILHSVKINDLYGLADDEQNVVVKGTWLSIGHFNNGIAFAQSIDGKYGLINHFGQVVISYQWILVDDFFDGIARVQAENKKYGFVNNKGKTISNCIWDSAEHFSEGMACVISTKESGYIDNKGVMSIPYNEGKMTSFSEGLACVSNSDGNWGYINKEGRLVIPFQWEIAFPFRDGLACVFSKKFGFINEKGDYVIPCMLDGAGSFGNGLAPVYDMKSNLWGYVDKNGKLIIDYQWVSARSFHEGLACVEKNGVYGFINPQGELAIPRRFLEAGDFKDGFAAIIDCVDTHSNYVDKDGNLIYLEATNG